METEENNKKEEVKNKKEESTLKKKRGRKRINPRPTINEQKKFFIDYTNESKKHELVIRLVNEANNKEYGREITFKDLVDCALEKLTSRDIEKVKENSLGEMDKVNMQLEKHNLKHGTSLTLGEFLVKQLKIS
jgi:hypothetical protein